MESDSEAAESELGEAVSVQGNLKFGKKGNKDEEIYYNFYPCLPNRALVSMHMRFRVQGSYFKWKFPKGKFFV